MPHTTVMKLVFSEDEFKFIGYCKLPIRLPLQGQILKNDSSGLKCFSLTFIDAFRIWTQSYYIEQVL